MGRYSDVGYGCCLVDCSIGNFCSLGANIRIGGASHPMSWVSTSQVFIDRPDSLKKKFSPKPYEAFRHTRIGHDVWIGDNALVKAGISIGTGAIVGMGSVVTKDVPAYAVVAGNPAKIIRYRFDEHTIKALLDSKWWQLDDKELEKAASYFDSAEEFITKFNEGDQ